MIRFPPVNFLPKVQTYLNDVNFQLQCREKFNTWRNVSNGSENNFINEKFLTLFRSSVNFQRFTYLVPSTEVSNLKGRCCDLEYQHMVPERLNLPGDKLVYVYCILVLCIWKKLVLKPQSRTESLKAFIKATIAREQIVKLRLQKVFILDSIYFAICIMSLRHSCLKKKTRKKISQYFHKYFKIV